MGKEKRKQLFRILPYAVIVIAVAAVLAVLFWPRASADDVMEQATPDALAATPGLSEEETDSHVNIPDPDALQPMPDPALIEMEPGRMTVDLIGGVAYISWEADPEADYYVLCVLDGQDTVLQRDILWADVDAWELAGYQGSRLLLLRYQDMGTKDAQDDELLGAYICETPDAVPQITPTSTPEASPTPGQTAAVSSTPRPSRTPAPTPTPNKYKIIVDKADHAFSIFTYDENGDYTVKVATYPTALGRSSRQTPTGTFTISSKGAWKTWSDGTYSPFYTRYTSGLYFHGPIYTAKSGDALIPESYNAIGTDASSGCMRTTVAGARFVYFNCPAGTVVEIVASSDKVSWPSGGKPAIDPDYPTWDPTDPDKPNAPPESTPSPDPTPSPMPTADPVETPTPVDPSETPSDASASASSPT